MTSDRPVFRFAPSPNGELHLGHALSVLIGHEQAKVAGGRFLVRIEDIDIGRARPEYVAGIFEDLRWLGAERDPDGAPLYPGLWRGRPEGDIAKALAAGRPYALRIDIAKACCAAAYV